ncbi:hypothetical protein V1517DRAFT_312398 [Lipomyces orientalis]|uniref:Uncharacterized protein n=1 Tax=Lipomyces orientalis TaxID=1233043 RepID=A0ACC3TY98_9ASCO
MSNHPANSPVGHHSIPQANTHKKPRSITPSSPVTASTTAASTSSSPSSSPSSWHPIRRADSSNSASYSGPITPTPTSPASSTVGNSWSSVGGNVSANTTVQSIESNASELLSISTPRTDYRSQSLYPLPQPTWPWFSDPSEPFPLRRGRRRNRAHSRARLQQLGILYDKTIPELIELRDALGIKLENHIQRPGQQKVEPSRTRSPAPQEQLHGVTSLPSTPTKTPAEPGAHLRTQSAKSWADIVKPVKPSLPVTAQSVVRTSPAVRPIQPHTASTSSIPTEPASPSSASSLSATTQISDATELEPPPVPSLEEDFEGKPPVLIPRGLVNTGNMCFMNSILQILLYCVPFYSFVDTMGKKLTHRFNSETPILDSLILFVQEFDPKTVARFGNNNTKSSPFGEPFIPEFVYDALRANTLFANMRRGHQEDAEEFLGFLLDGLHEEFLAATRQLQKRQANGINGARSHLNFVESAIVDLKIDEDNDEGDGWLEVGKKHKVVVTRTTSAALSPITKIFGGQFRSVISAAHQKPSVTLDPYQHVQLDISDPQIHTLEDALAKMSQTEVISHYKSDKGDMVEATKQTFFEKLPRVLILHLKRFHFAVEEGSGYHSVQKISKTIGYKCDLTIPPECISPQLRGVHVNYKLFGVVYHHGKSTEGGHYTVDLNYKHSDTWINFDDVSIKEIQPEDIETVYEDESAMRRRIIMGGSGDLDERTAYLLFYERV